jgi:hypothetical protein
MENHLSNLSKNRMPTHFDETLSIEPIVLTKFPKLAMVVFLCLSLHVSSTRDCIAQDKKDPWEQPPRPLSSDRAKESSPPSSSEEPEKSDDQKLKKRVKSGNQPKAVQETSPEIKLVFKNSALLTPPRKNRITMELNAFRNYLMALGFEVPKGTPAFGTAGAGKGWTAASSSDYGDPALSKDIYIAEEAVDDLTTWRRAYAYYVFDKIFSQPPSAGDLFFIRTWDTYIFTDYFASSYANQRPKDSRGMGGWVSALWEIRDSCGWDFTDRSLFYTYKSIIQYEEKGFKVIDEEEVKIFNKYFSTHFFHGVWVLDNNLQTRPPIGIILRKHKLLEND